MIKFLFTFLLGAVVGITTFTLAVLAMSNDDEKFKDNGDR